MFQRLKNKNTTGCAVIVISGLAASKAAHAIQFILHTTKRSYKHIWSVVAGKDIGPQMLSTIKVIKSAMYQRRSCVKSRKRQSTCSKFTLLRVLAEFRQFSCALKYWTLYM
ncbi:hypothetical protein ILYODFUR_019641 [Ilyodon furcidens]|uniref:Uncharacterized protein n=1 Tax=Ilyodon furcidens TaxID=33524 RepID=A0ABV0UKA3_9TELE